MRDFTIQLTHRPGELANVANALSLKGVNIKSLAAMNLGHQAVMRLIFRGFNAKPVAWRYITSRTFAAHRSSIGWNSTPAPTSAPPRRCAPLAPSLNALAPASRSWDART